MNNPRLSRILKLLEETDSLSIQDILLRLKQNGFDITKITLNRDLDYLLKQGKIAREGRGKATIYRLAAGYKLQREIDFAYYFSVHADERKIQKEFNFDIFPNLVGLFTDEEIKNLENLNNNYRANKRQSSQTLIRKELERLVIDLSWKSSKLEGNTYTLLDTEKLIVDEVEARGHSREEAIMILNHKKALDYIVDKKNEFVKLDIKKIQKIHSLLTYKLDIQKGFRNKRIGIIGTSYRPLEKQVDIVKAMEALCKLVNSEKFPLAKALIVIAVLSYIQAFEDGNKRTARIVSTAILMACDFCPISYRIVDEFDYKKSLILFYEQNNIAYIKQLFVDQFKFSVGEYF